MTWTGKNFVVGDILTAANMNNLQADISAQANGDVGAPKQSDASFTANTINADKLIDASITNGKLSDSSVSINKLKYTFGEVSDVLTAGSSALQTLPGGSHGYYPMVKSSSGIASVTAQIAFEAAGTTYASKIYVTAAVGNQTITTVQYYIQASPPYYIDDVYVPLFVFLEVGKNGDILGMYSAPEAPWHYNGPSSIIPSERKANFKNRKDMAGVSTTLKESVESIDTLRSYVDSFRKAPTILEELTDKNKDMNLIGPPTNIIGTETVSVMVDPTSTCLEEISDMYCHDEFSLMNLIERGYLCISNFAKPSISGPSWSKVMTLKWKNSK